MNVRDLIDRAQRQGVTLRVVGYDVHIGGRTASRRLLRDIVLHRAAIVRELAPTPETCCECGARLPEGHKYRCEVCADAAVRADAERWRSLPRLIRTERH